MGLFFPTDAEAKGEYIKVVMQCEMHSWTFFPVRYVGFWSLPLCVDLGINENGFIFLHKLTKVSDDTQKKINFLLLLF